MNKSLWFSLGFLPALVVPALTQTLSPDRAKDKIRHTVIAKSNDAAPEGGTYNPFSFSDATLNARSEIAFDAVVTGPPPSFAIFLNNRKTTSTIALGTNPNPAEPSFGIILKPFITNDGDVVFDANGEVLKSIGKRIIPLVRVGDEVHGHGTVASLGGRIANDHGVIAYSAGVTESSATQAIFRTDGFRTTTIASDDITPPTGGSFTSFQSFDLNNRGEVAFKADMTGGSADHGIFRGDGGRLTPVFVSNQAAPEGGAFEDCGIPVINMQGQVAAVCMLTSGPGNAGLFVGNGKETVAIALDGQPAPKGSGNYAFIEANKINARGEVAFQALLTDGVSGMFRSNGKRATALALSGTNAPGTTGTFQSFGDFEFGDNGRIAFVASLVSGVGGVDTSNNTGIWVGTTEADLKLVVRTGDIIDGNVLTNLPLIDTTGDAFDMNENSVLWRGNLGVVKALVLSRISDDNDGGRGEN